MTNATSTSLADFISRHSFESLSLLSLVAVAVLVVALFEQEVLRSMQPDNQRRNARVFGIAIFPLAGFAVFLIVTRFIELG